MLKTWSMTWSYETFVSEGDALVARSKRALQEKSAMADDHAAVWAWRRGRRENLIGNAYLVSTENVRRHGQCHGNVDETTASACSDMDDWLVGQEMSDDDAALQSGSTGEEETALYEFHIVFHPVYQTAVLYFRLTQIDGSPMAFEAAEHGRLQLPGGNSRGTFVSMDEHPILGTPFYFLHPCETASAMALLLDHATITTLQQGASAGEESTPPPRYLLAWLSLVQPLTSINPMQYQ